MKKYINYIILGILIIALVIGVVVLSGIDTGKNNEEAPVTESIEIYAVNSSDIASLNIKNIYGEYTVLYDTDIKIKGLDIKKDDEKLKYLLSELSSMYALSVASENSDTLDEFGLLNPKASAEIMLKNGEKSVIYIGDNTPAMSGYYAKLNDENKVYIIGDYSADVLLRKLDYYRNTVLFTIDANNVTDFSFEKDGKKVAFTRNNESDINRNTFASFNMITPYNWEAEGTELEKIFALLNQLNILEYVEDNPADLSEYGLDMPSAVINIKNKDLSSYEMKIGKNVDAKYYITVNGNKTVYLIEAAGFEFLSFEPTAFLQEFVSIRVIDNVSKFSYIHNDINAEFEIKKIDTENHDIKYKGKLVDQKSFKQLYTEIISMSTSGTVNFTPSDAPVLQYTFTYLDGEQETIKYYKYDDRKIAVSVNNVINFYVDSSEFNKRVNLIDDIIKNKF